MAASFEKSFMVMIISLLVILPLNNIYGHQIDSVGDYRVEIGWINEPAFSKETNGIEFYISELDKTLPPEEQQFDPTKGIVDLEDDLKIELVFKGEKIKLPVFNDHNVKGKYYTLVDPTVPGYYQLNILGKINDTVVSKSLHPPKVDDRSFIEFPKSSPTEQILEEHETIGSQLDQVNSSLNKIKEKQVSMESEIDSLKSTIADSKKSGFSGIEFAGVGIGLVAIAVGVVAYRKR